ncbi:MAG: hypothetical protein F6J90_21915 [Moorea sp. SIOASIH]|nr:hypothetical protein [Moorena sp. SIOASIH]
MHQFLCFREQKFPTTRAKSSLLLGNYSAVSGQLWHRLLACDLTQIKPMLTCFIQRVHLIKAVWVVRYGTDCPNTGYRENQGEPVPNAPYAISLIFYKYEMHPLGGALRDGLS